MLRLKHPLERLHHLHLQVFLFCLPPPIAVHRRQVGHVGHVGQCVGMVLAKHPPSRLPYLRKRDLCFVVPSITVQAQREIPEEPCSLFRILFHGLTFKHVARMCQVQPPYTPVPVVIIWKHLFQVLHRLSSPLCQRLFPLEPVPYCQMHEPMDVDSVACSRLLRQYLWALPAAKHDFYQVA